MRKITVLAVAISALAIGFFASYSVSHAQIGSDVVPRDIVVCETERYDLNGDGLLGKSDMYYWMQTASNRGCEMGGAAVGNCVDLDLDQNGTIDVDDVMVMYNHFLTCYVPANVVPTPR